MRVAGQSGSFPLGLFALTIISEIHPRLLQRFKRERFEKAWPSHFPMARALHLLSGAAMLVTRPALSVLYQPFQSPTLIEINRTRIRTRRRRGPPRPGADRHRSETGPGA
jgi:hypothetical protein